MRTPDVDTENHSKILEKENKNNHLNSKESSNPLEDKKVITTFSIMKPDPITPENNTTNVPHRVFRTMKPDPIDNPTNAEEKKVFFTMKPDPILEKDTPKFEAELIDRIDTKKEDPNVKARLEQNDKIESSQLPTKTGEGNCIRCLVC